MCPPSLPPSSLCFYCQPPFDRIWDRVDRLGIKGCRAVVNVPQTCVKVPTYSPRSGSKSVLCAGSCIRQATRRAGVCRNVDFREGTVLESSRKDFILDVAELCCTLGRFGSYSLHGFSRLSPQRYINCHVLFNSFFASCVSLSPIF